MSEDFAEYLEEEEDIMIILMMVIIWKFGICLEVEEAMEATGSIGFIKEKGVFVERLEFI